MNYSSIERKSFKIGVVFTILTHISIILISYYSSHKKQENNFVKKPEYIEAVLLKKGDSDETGKSKKFLPDKTDNDSKNKSLKDNKKEKTEVTKDDLSKNEKKTENIKDDSIDLSKKLNNISKQLENDKKITNVTDKISKELSNRNTNIAKNSVDKKKGNENGVDDGTETDPSKTVQGSLYGRRVATELKKQWKIPPIDESQLSDLVVTAIIYISEDGTILKYKITKESKKILFTNSVKFLLEKVKKVAAPPSDYVEYYEKYGMEIDFVPKKE